MNVLLVGVGYYPCRMSGDKNFWVELAPLLARQTGQTVVLSINDAHQPTTVQTTDGGPVTIYNVRRFMHLGQRSGQVSTLAYYHHKHAPLPEMLELSATVLSNWHLLKRITSEHSIDIVHFMDNFGPAMALVKALLPGARVTHSAASYSARGRMYDAYLQRSFGALDRIIPYTHAYREKLIAIGIPRHMLHTIRWGVHPRHRPQASRAKRELRQSLGITAPSTLFLWSGYIQQIQERDFMAALAVAREVTEQSTRCHFVFAFKPESYQPRYLGYERDRISIVTDVPDFLLLLETADFLFSPLIDGDLIVAPPLTWVESLASGTPIITTRAGAVDEIVTEGQTGFVADGLCTLADVVQRAIDSSDRSRMSQMARQLAVERYDIRHSACEYVALWRELAG